MQEALATPPHDPLHHVVLAPGYKDPIKKAYKVCSQRTPAEKNCVATANRRDVASFPCPAPWTNDVTSWNYRRTTSLLRGSWDLVIRVINKVTMVIFNYNSIMVLITLLAESHDPPITVGAFAAAPALFK